MQQTQQQQQTAALVRQLQQQLSSKSQTSLFEHLLLRLVPILDSMNTTSLFFCRFTARTGHQFIFLIMSLGGHGDGLGGGVLEITKQGNENVHVCSFFFCRGEYQWKYDNEQVMVNNGTCLCTKK